MRNALASGAWVLGLATLLGILPAPVARAEPVDGKPVLVNGHPVAADTDNAGLAWLRESIDGARIVHLTGDSEESAESFHETRLRLIRFLHQEAGYNVLVLPVGIYEGARLDGELERGASPAEASVTLYRVWRQSDAFARILEYARSTHDEKSRLEIIGGLCRFHAAGKSLYSPHLTQFFDEAGDDLLDAATRERIDARWGGTARLSRGSPEDRKHAASLAADMEKLFEKARPALESRHGKRRVDLEHQLLLNMATFVELEKMRGKDIPPDPSIEHREKAQNLSWFLDRRYPGEKLIYWGGRGAAKDLPSEARVVRLEIAE